MSSKDSLTTRSLVLMVPSWEHKVCVLLATPCKARVPMKAEAHCAWIQTCRSLSVGDGEHDGESCARSDWFPTAPQLPLQCKSVVPYAGQIVHPYVNRNTRCPSSMSLFPENFR